MYIRVESEQEAVVATSAIASLRYELSCTCDFDTGYVCKRCGRLLGVETAYEYETFMERYSDLIYNKRFVRSPEEQGEAKTQPIIKVKTPAAPTHEGEICPQCGGAVLEEFRSGVCQSCGVYYPIKSGKLLLT